MNSYIMSIEIEQIKKVTAKKEIKSLEVHFKMDRNILKQDKMQNFYWSTKGKELFSVRWLIAKIYLYVAGYFVIIYFC